MAHILDKFSFRFYPENMFSNEMSKSHVCAKILFLSIGKAGARIVEKILLKTATYPVLSKAIIIDDDMCKLAQSVTGGTTLVCLTASERRDVGTTTVSGIEVSYLTFDHLSNTFGNFDWLFVVEGSSSETEKTEAARLIQMAKRSKVFTTGFISPRPCYGTPSNRFTSQAASAVDDLGLDSAICFLPGNAVLNRHSEYTQIQHHGSAEASMLFAIESLIGLFEPNGLIAADFADYRQVLSRGRVFSFGSAVGFDCHEGLDAVLTSPPFIDSPRLKARIRIGVTSTSSAKYQSLSVDRILPFMGRNDLDLYYFHYMDECLRDKVRVSLFASDEV